MTLGRHLVVSLVALAMAGVAAGCGGGGDNTGEVMRATLKGMVAGTREARRQRPGPLPSMSETTPISPPTLS